MSTIDVQLKNGELTAKLIKFGDVSFLQGEASKQHYPLPKFDK